MKNKSNSNWLKLLFLISLLLKRSLEVLMAKVKRDYRKEYLRDHDSPKAKKHRAMRNSARKKMGLKKGDPREVDHKKPLSKGGSNGKGNLRVVKAAYNRRKAAKSK